MTEREKLIDATARFAIAEYQAALDAAGFVIVPREPTEAMLAALRNQWPGGTGSDATRWTTMVDAAPNPTREQS